MTRDVFNMGGDDSNKIRNFQQRRRCHFVVQKQHSFNSQFVANLSKMSTNEKKLLDREALRSVIQQWNANRLDLFELSEPDENLQFHGVMRFYFQDTGQKVATKCIRVASDATVQDVIETLIEKFRPDMRMLSLPNYALYEVHSSCEERKLNSDEKPLLVQLNWHIDDREGRFLLRNTDQKTSKIVSQSTTESTTEVNFKRKLSKREKKEQKKKEKLQKQLSSGSKKSESSGLIFTKDDQDGNHVAQSLYRELPETSFTRSISNPEAVMRRRRQQKLEKKLQQFRSKDGGPDTGGTLKIYGESLCRDVPYKTLLLSIRDCAQAVVREMLAKYSLDKADPLHYCLVQVNSDGTEYILDDDECPLSILMNHPTSRGSIMFHVRRRPADSQPRRRKKKPLGISNSNSNMTVDREGPVLVEITTSQSGEGARRVKLNSEPIEVGSANTNMLQLFGPLIQPRHCLISLHEGVCTVTPLHADALTFVNGHHITQPTILHNGSVVMFGRVASYKFVDSPSDGRYNLALSQSQLDSACLYESRSPTSWHEDDRPLSPSVAQGQTKNFQDSDDRPFLLNSPTQSIPISAAAYDAPKAGTPSNGNISNQYLNDASQSQSGYIKEQFETNFDVDGNVETETKSISSVKSGGSVVQENHRNKMGPPSAMPTNISSVSGNEQGQEPILPAVLEFPETHQERFLRHVIVDLDVNVPNFKLAPVYTLYLCARYRASTHYRPDLQPTERALKLTAFLHHVSNLIFSCVQEQYADPKILSFWMANSSEFLHFLKCDRHISAFSTQAQEILAESVQIAFRNLVNSFHADLSQTLNQFLSENIDHDSAAGLVLQVLGGAMALLRRCRVNAALTIQLFSQLFHYINVVCFNKFITTPQMCNAAWGKVLSERLQLLEAWAERQGLELAADCHLAKINQCAQFLQAPKTSVIEVQQLAHSCFRLNSLQMAALISQEQIPRNLVDTAVRMAESVADELTRADGREIKLEESPDLPLALLLPDDGYSSDVVRGIPVGLVDFLSPLQNAGMCRLAAQPTSIGLWTVYMHQYSHRSPSAMSTKMPQPEMQVIKLHKHTSGFIGLSIVAAKGAGQERLGIYVKSVVPGGAADADGRLQAGDQLLRVDGSSLMGITQERAADYLVRTGPIVTLEVAKQGAIYHGLATLLQQPSPVIQRGAKRVSERENSRLGHLDSTIPPSETSILSTASIKPPIPSPGNIGQPLINSKSVPSLNNGNNIAMMVANKSRSIHNLAVGGSIGPAPKANNSASSLNDQGFYQNLSIYRGQHISQPNLGLAERNPPSLLLPQQYNSSQGQPLQNRPSSAYYQSNNNSESMVQPNLSQQNLLSYTMVAQQQPRPFNRLGDNNQAYPIVEGPSHQNTNMNQMLAPSMPNIAHSSGYASNISSSQSMHNVHQIPHHNFAGMQPNAQQNTNLRGQAMLSEMGEMMRRKQHKEISPMTPLDVTSAGQSSFPSPMLISPNTQQLKPPTSSMLHLSPLKQLPPTAPKPQFQRQAVPDTVDEKMVSPPLPPTTTHPLYKPSQLPGSNQSPHINYVAADPPKVAFYPPHNRNTTATTNNPWEREEREKEQELRREHLRLWRDQQINDLSGLMYRSPQQDEQLKSLILERDFERRAQMEHEQEVDNDDQNGQNVQEKKQSSNKSEELVDEVQSNTGNLSTSIQPKSILKHNSNTVNGEAPMGGGPIQQISMKQSKTASFSDQVQMHRSYEDSSQNIGNNETNPSLAQMMQGQLNLNTDLSANVESSQASKNFHTMNRSTEEVSNQAEDDYNPPPPPPPERNSSFTVMSQQQQKLRQLNISSHSHSPTGTNNNHLNNNNNNNLMIPPPSNFNTNSANFRDNKRVSFHDEDNNEEYSVPEALMYNSTSADLVMITEDPNKFIEETTALLETPTTPDQTISWNSSVQHTPGVIGAQEVYRDPRTRRLAEKERNKEADAIPEKMSFKEKMKMFCENQTPKDKLKISRAQRDIDAVH